MKKNVSKILALLISILMFISYMPITNVFVNAEPVLTSGYASYAAEGHSNTPLVDKTFDVKGDTVKISILTTSDMHGRVYDWNSYTNSPLSNNFLQVAEIIQKQRAESDDSIVIDNGDILQGTAVSSYNNTQEAAKSSPIATCLRYIGYDVFNLGNHEFNYSPEIQWNYYNYLKSTDSTLPGSTVDVVCANIIENETQESVFSPYKLFPYKFEDGTTYTIAVITFENMNNANWDVASHYEGCNFAHEDNKEMSFAYEYETYWKKELEEKADFIIASVHSGGGSTDTYNQESQGYWFINNTSGIDLLITGHDHRAVADYVLNKNGDKVPVLNGGGSSVAELEVTLTKAENEVSISCAEPVLHEMKSEASAPNNREGDDATFQSKTSKEYNELKVLIKTAFENADKFVNATLGTVSGAWDAITDFYTKQSDSYDLVHKAQIWAATTSYGLDTAKNHVVSITTPVANRGFYIGSLISEGKTSATISLKDCYSLYRYDNNTLFMIKMNGQQLINWLQTVADTYQQKEGAITGGGFGADQFYGINYEINLTNPKGEKAVNITFEDGTPVKPEDEIYTCLSSYRLSATEGSDAYGWYAATGITSNSKEVLWDATTSEEFNVVGGSVPLIVGEYIKSLTEDGKDVTPGSITKWNIPTVHLCDIYQDLDQKSWYHEGVHYALEHAWMNGVGNNLFSPDANLDRATVVTVLYRMANTRPNENINPSTFSDVANNQWYSDAVSWAQENEIVNGYEDSTFRPHNKISRQEMMTILTRYAEKIAKIELTTEGNTDNFTDSETVSDWAKNAVIWCVNNNIINGKNGQIAPTDGATRAEFATILMRAIEGPLKK